MKKVFGILIMFSLNSIVSGQAQEEVIIYKKGACFGQCPMYDITVSDSGKLTFEGKRFLDALGSYERQLTKKEFRKVKRYFRRARMQKIPFEDESNIMDAALTTIKYNEHAIKRKTGTPEQLKKAEGFLLSLTPLAQEAEFDWTFTPHPEPKVQNNGRKENAQPEIIVQMAADVDFNAWLVDYHKYGLTMKKKLVPNRELYLLSYEPKILSFKAVLKRLQSDSAVKSAEENKKVEQR